MEFIHFASESELNDIQFNGIRIAQNYRGVGILIYPLVNINFKSPNLDYLDEEISMNSSLSIEEAWKIVAAEEIRQSNQKTCGFTFKLTPEFWPLNVYIDVKSDIAKKFAEEFDKINSRLVRYISDKGFHDVVNSIKYERYTLETEFRVTSEIGLNALIECFSKSGGGIWGAHSFDCLINKNIASNDIERIIGLNVL